MVTLTHTLTHSSEFIGPLRQSRGSKKNKSKLQWTPDGKKNKNHKKQKKEPKSLKKIQIKN